MTLALAALLAEAALGYAPVPSAANLRPHAIGNIQRGSSAMTRRQNAAVIACGASMQSSRRDFGAAAMAGLIAIGVGLPREANADRSYTSMTTAYRSYVPRIKASVKFYREDLLADIQKGDWEKVADDLKPGSKAAKLAYVTKYSSGVVNEVVELKGILKIFASSITASDSESTVTQKLYQFLTKYAEFNEQILTAAAAGDKEAALKAHKAGSYALQLYIETINKEIPRSLGKINMDEAPSEPAPGGAVAGGATP